MIPFFTYRTIPIGPLNLQVWGLLVALGIILSLWLGRRRAVRLGLDGTAWLDMSAWSLVAGVVGARLLYVIAYQPEFFVSTPQAIFRLWDGGMSAFGAFIGAGLAWWLYCRRQGLPTLSYLNVAAFVMPWGYAVGRIGCFLIHDHIGLVNRSWLAVDFPGAAKLDIGLLHVLLGLGIGIAFLIVDRQAKGRERPYFFLLLAVYGAARFALDFLRYWDAPFVERRYAKLTPAQYLSLPAMVAGFYFLANPPRPTLWQRWQARLIRIRAGWHSLMGRLNVLKRLIKKD